MTLTRGNRLLSPTIGVGEWLGLELDKGDQPSPGSSEVYREVRVVAIIRGLF